MIAARTYQDYLDVVTRAFLDGDFETFLQHVSLPFMMSTQSYQIVASSAEELDVILSDLRALLTDNKITLYRRTCIEARFVDASRTTIVGSHLTEMFTDDGPVAPNRTGSMALLRVDGTWKGIWLDNRASDNVITTLSEDVSEAQSKTRFLTEMNTRRRRQPTKG